MGKNTPANAGDIRDTVSVPGSGRSLGAGRGNPLQYSCLKNPMDRGARWAIVHGVAKIRRDVATKQQTSFKGKSTSHFLHEHFPSYSILISSFSYSQKSGNLNFD